MDEPSVHPLSAGSPFSVLKCSLLALAISLCQELRRNVVVVLRCAGWCCRQRRGWVKVQSRSQGERFEFWTKITGEIKKSLSRRLGAGPDRLGGEQEQHTVGTSQRNILSEFEDTEEKVCSPLHPRPRRPPTPTLAIWNDTPSKGIQFSLLWTVFLELTPETALPGSRLNRQSSSCRTSGS